MTVLVDWQIRQLRDEGEIVIEPFDPRQLKSGSYDIRVGQYYYREQYPVDPLDAYINPWAKGSSERLWGEPLVAEFGREMKDKRIQEKLQIGDDQQAIILAPRETILCHTIEFIGGRESVITSMQARSSIGRNGIEICKCAGWGDHGYYNRWTMEVTNNEQHAYLPLFVGMRVGQIIFMKTKVPQQNYSYSGKYQTTSDLSDLMANWKPSDMLPKLWLDWELQNKDS